MKCRACGNEIHEDVKPDGDGYVTCNVCGHYQPNTVITTSAEPEKELAEHTVDHLRAVAESLGIKSSGLKKAQLIEAIESAQEGT